MENKINKVKRITKMPRIPRRPPDAHKGDFGHDVIIAGSRGMLGAGLLAVAACLRSGAGLVTLVLPASLNNTAQGKIMEMMTSPQPETPEGTLAFSAREKLLAFLSDKDAVAIGPGLSQHPETQKLVREIIRRLALPLVVDADGLNALKGNINLLSRRKAPTVLTPHPGELGRLIGKSAAVVQANRQEIAAGFARQYGVVLVLKGAGTVVTDGEKMFVNTTGNPGMATGGAGDVLTGIITALIGQGIEPFQAAQLGVYIHGLAGDSAIKGSGEISMIASDLIAFLPYGFQQVS